jgi:hypothetical protein
MVKLWDTNKKIEKNFNTQEEAYAFIQEYLDNINYKPYYFRQSFINDDTIWIDYGSYSHFFYIQFIK